jgi:hypothetical protein
MAMIEDAYQIRDYANIFVASENLIWIPPTGSTRPYANYVANITPSTSARDLAIAIVTEYAAWLNDVYPNRFGYTLSAVDLGQMNPVTTAISSLASAIKSQMSTYISQVTAARTVVQKFDSDDNYVIDTQDEYVDLYDFAQQVKTRIADSTIQNSAQAVMNAISGYVITTTALPGNERYPFPTMDKDKTHGVSIFFPRAGFRRSFYTGLNLDFAADTTWGLQSKSVTAPSGTIGWGPMLVEHVNTLTPNAPDDPAPPELAAPLSNWQIFLPVVIRTP